MIEIRKAKEADSEKLWILMKDLAVFEKYTDSFAITPEVVRESGFRKNPPDFYCLVAEDVDSIVPYHSVCDAVDDNFRSAKQEEDRNCTLRMLDAGLTTFQRLSTLYHSQNELVKKMFPHLRCLLFLTMYLTFAHP